MAGSICPARVQLSLRLSSTARKRVDMLRTQEGGGRGGAPYNGLYGEALPETGDFFTIQVYERVGRSVVSVSKKAPKGLTDVKKSRKRYDFLFIHVLKRVAGERDAKF